MLRNKNIDLDIKLDKDWNRKIEFEDEINLSETQSQISNVETDIISIPSFGTFEVKKRLERIVVNPATKKRMLVPPKLVLGFKPVQSIKEQLKNASFEDEEGGLDE